MSSHFKPGYVVCPACRSRTFFKDQPWKVTCLPCYLQRKGISPRPPAPAAPVLEASMVRRLLQLAHPDRHNGSEAAHVATRYLLSLKNLLNR
jgi:DNA-directed RNA polymerase subunit RPC12/RpoP